MSLLDEVRSGLRIQYAPVSGGCALTKPPTAALSGVAANMVRTTDGFMDELVRYIHAWELIALRDAGHLRQFYESLNGSEALPGHGRVLMYEAKA